MPTCAARRASSHPARRVAAGALLAVLSTCNLDHVEITAGGTASIPKKTLVDALLGTLAFTGFDNIDFTQEFQHQGVTKDEVDSVKLKTFTLTIDAPANGNFDFLQSIAFVAQADGTADVQIASMSPVPKGRTQLDLAVDPNAELKPFVVAPSMRITSKAEGGKPDADTTVRAAVTLDVDVHIPGCN